MTRIMSVPPSQKAPRRRRTSSALERRDAVLQAHCSRGADSAALTKEPPNPEVQKVERPRKGAAI